MSTSPRLLEGRYRLLRVVARGGMGQVWEARDELLGRTVAIKEVRFPSDVPEEERAVMGERTMREAKLTARLTHRGIITIYDVICVDDRPFIVMELVRAPSLARQVDEHGPLLPNDVAGIGLALLDALAVAHAEGILHRDVKPSNVLLAPGRVVLTDFGIATSESDSTLTSTGLLVGSPTYMSPERLRGEGIEPAADIWSLGATLYAALEGEPPFRASTTIATITAVLVDQPEPPYVEGPLGDAILGMLDKDVTNRLTGEQAAGLLRASLEKPGTVGAPPLSGAVPAADGDQPPLMAPAVTWDDPMHLREEEIGDLAGSGVSGARRSFSFVAPPPAPPPLSAGEASLHSAAYDDRATDGAGQDNWAGDDGSSRSRSRGRGGWLAALTLLVAVSVVAAIAWSQLNGSPPSTRNDNRASGSNRQHQHRGQGRGSGKHTASPPRSTRRTAAPPLTSTPTPPPTSSASTSAPTSAATSVPSSTVPAGYQLVDDPLGFQVAVPEGWQRRYTGSSYVDYVSPDNSAQYLRIDQVPQAGPSALQAWVDYEPSLKRSLPGYQRVRLASVPFRGWEAADLEWTYDGSNGTLHVLDRGFITNPRGFALLMQGPDATWKTDSLPVFNVAAQTFQPTS